MLGSVLLLNVSKSWWEVWRFRYSHPITKNGRHTRIGRFPEFSLAEAREIRDDFGDDSRGVDPSDPRIKIVPLEMSTNKSTKHLKLLLMHGSLLKRDRNCGNPTLY